jgi:lipopolysaccharide/colanic/teichoic acid biosynthesis glycosyltransferase
MPRVLEAIIGAAGLLVLSPFLAIIAAFVKLQDGGSVFYRAKRVGKNGKEFEGYKFRTMVPDADSIGVAITTSGDRRITPLGKYLRKYKLDELPQLINVLKGEMSLVGARPEDPRYVAFYNEEQRQVLEFRPGITSPASLKYRYEESLLNGTDWLQQYVDVVLPKKLALDLSYLKQRSVFSDIVIILRTLGGIIK